MAKTTVMMESKKLEVFSEEVAPVFEIRSGSELVGRLTVSTGGVRWAPSGNRGEPYFHNWKDFDDVMRKSPTRA